MGLYYTEMIYAMLKESLKDSSFKEFLNNFFSNYKRHYDFDNLDMYDIYEISVTTIDKEKLLISLADNNVIKLRLLEFIALCKVINVERELNKK